MVRRFSHYGRKSPRKVAGEPERAVFPMLVEPYRKRSYAFAPDSPYRLSKDPEFMVYQPGDIIYVRTELDKVEIAKVLGVNAEPRYTVYEGVREISEYIPRWKVQFLNKNGFWSGLWKYVWPGEVYRAYHDPVTEQPVFRPDFMLKEFLDELK